MKHPLSNASHVVGRPHRIAGADLRPDIREHSSQ